MKATDLNLSEMPAMTLHGPDGFGLTQYSGDEYALVGGFRDGASNAGELRLKYQIYSHALIDANGGDFAKGEIGYCVVRVASDDGPDQGEILGLIDIELKPKYRKSGHGKKIVRDIVDTTKSGNLDIHDIQKKAKKFWDKMGVEYDAKKPGAKNAVLRKQSESVLDEDIASVAEVAAMAAVAGLAAPVMMAMIKAAYKTGKGMLQLRKIARKAGVRLADKVMGEAKQLTVQPHMTGLENPYQKQDKRELKVFTQAYKDMYNKAQAAQDKADATGGPGASYQTPVMNPKFSPQVLPQRTKPKKPRPITTIKSEELSNFDKDQPMKSTVAVPGYGTMNIDSLMKNVIDQATAMIKQMQQGTQGFRNADYALNRNRVLPTKIAALVQALDDLQAIRSKGGARSRNIQQEAEEQEPLPIDITRIMNTIQEYESKQYIPVEDADIMRRGISALQTGRQSLGAEQMSVLQLLTMLSPE